MKFLSTMLAALVFTAEPAAAEGKLPLVPVGDVPLGGHTTRWDYASLDSATGRLFLAHLGDSVVTVFDTRMQRVVGEVPGISNVHGVLAIPELGRVYASATGNNEVVVIDSKTLKVLARIPSGDYPDGIAYAPEVHKLYVSDEHGGTDTVIDVQSHARVATIRIGREVGNTQYDPLTRHMFVNEQVSNELVEIDPVTDLIVRRNPLPGARSAHGLAIDAAGGLAFIGCEDNDTLLVFDLAGRKVVASYKVGSGPDVLAFDSALGWLYVAGEAGIVSIFKKDKGGLVKVAEDLLGPNAHVVAVDPATHRAYFPLKDVDGRSVLRMMAPRTN